MYLFFCPCTFFKKKKKEEEEEERKKIIEYLLSIRLCTWHHYISHDLHKTLGDE